MTAASQGSFTHRGYRYDLGLLMLRVEGRSVWMFQVSELRQLPQNVVPEGQPCPSCKHGPPSWHEQRIADADLDAPLLVYEDDTVLDGLHRLEKAARLQRDVVPVIEVSDEDLRQCLVAEQRLVQIGRRMDAQWREKYQNKCTSCGACCAYFAREPGMIHANGPAVEDETLTYFLEDKHTNRWPDGDNEEVDSSRHVMRTGTLGEWPACVALKGEIGKEIGCSIYETRPSNCREFAPGSVLCLAARAWAGIKEEADG